MLEETKSFKLVGAGSLATQEKIEKPALSFLQDAWRRLKHNKLAVIAMGFLAVLLLFSIGSLFVVSTDDANSFNSKEVSIYRNLPPKLSSSLPFWNGPLPTLVIQSPMTLMRIKGPRGQGLLTRDG